MLKLLKRFDDGVARGETALATTFLLSMIVAASIQAVARNLASEAGVESANVLVGYLSWVNPFLQKGTLWLAFLGASLATREERHIGVDLLPRLVPRKGKLLMRGIAGLGSSVVAFFLARAFWSAVLVNAHERPADYEVFGDEGPMHVCDAAANVVADAGLQVPHFFCAVRGALASVGVPVETGQAALQLIVPVMFVIISARLLANAIQAFMDMGKPPPEPSIVPRRRRAEPWTSSSSSSSSASRSSVRRSSPSSARPR